MIIVEDLNLTHAVGLAYFGKTAFSREKTSLIPLDTLHAHL